MGFDDELAQHRPMGQRFPPHMALMEIWGSPVVDQSIGRRFVGNTENASEYRLPGGVAWNFRFGDENYHPRVEELLEDLLLVTWTEQVTGLQPTGGLEGPP